MVSAEAVEEVLFEAHAFKNHPLSVSRLCSLLDEDVSVSEVKNAVEAFSSQDEVDVGYYTGGGEYGHAYYHPSATNP